MSLRVVATTDVSVIVFVFPSKYVPEFPHGLLQADPELRRTVLVSTKLDTRIPQFARPDDVELFLKPPSCLLDGIILGGSPFFTSVPSGRVGSSKDSVFRSNTDFQEVVPTSGTL